MAEYEDPQERIEEFLRTYKDEQGNKVYWTKIEKMSIDGWTSLTIDFQDLTAFDNEFVSLAGQNPVAFLNMASDALYSVLGIADPEYVTDLDRGLVKARFINHPEYVKLRAIRAKHIGKLLQISGILMRASEVKPLLVQAVFQCRLCDTEIPQDQEEGRYTEPALCPTCDKKTPLRLLPQKSTFRDWQKVRVQESPDELPAGSMPRSADVILEGDIVDVSRPGDFVRITGVLKTTPDFSRRGSRLATFNVFIEANGVEVSEKEFEQDEATEEEKEEIEELARDPYIHRRIIKSIAPAIQGHLDIKESIALLMFGGREKRLPDGTRLREKSNVLMIGDPGTGKSQILKFVSDIAPRGLYTSGKGTTAAGLTAAVVHDTDTGAMTLEAGALVLADKGIACIDEFDKMDPNDRTAIHEAMEQHTVSIAKAGIVATLNARTSILAAANPTFGRYDPAETMQSNIRLPFTILSRFDLIWIIRDTIDEDEDRKLASFILGMHQMKPREESTDEDAPIHSDLLKKYIAHANRYYFPELSDEAVEVIESFYVNIRKEAEGGAIPITARQLESLVRLAEARAKMALRPKVTREDADAAVRLMRKSLIEVAGDAETGQIDVYKVMTGWSTEQRTSSQVILKTVEQMEDEGIANIDRDDLIQRVVSAGIAREKAEEIIQKLVNDGLLYTPKTGKIRRVRDTV